MRAGRRPPEGEALPPRDYWLIENPKKDKIETPVDERGLVQIDKTIEAVKSTVHPDWEWQTKYNDVHHFYYYRSWYQEAEGSPTGINAFGELPIHKGLLPRNFHNWLHVVLLPPPVPSEETIQYRLEAYRITHDLFRAARETVQTQRMARRRQRYTQDNPQVLRADFEGVDVIGQEIMQDWLEKHFDVYAQTLEELERVPRDFHIIDLEPMARPHDIARKLGGLILGGLIRRTASSQISMNLVPKVTGLGV